jgi:putative ABC transport system permease protein
MVPAETPLFPYIESRPSELREIEDKEDMVIYAHSFSINQDVAQFYGIKMKEGDGGFNLSNAECLINETMAKQLGFSNPIGKTFWGGNTVIKGVIYDYAYQSPSEPIRAAFFRSGNKMPSSVAFKYSGDFATCKAAIEKAFEEQGQNLSKPFFLLRDGETVYKGYIESELNLLKLLNIITIISVLIALFGVYALILQECERQRKNIAIRKVFGATTRGILVMFNMQYLRTLAMCFILAAPVAYTLYNKWIESFAYRTPIHWWLFAVAFLIVAIVICLTVTIQSWRAAKERPVETIMK